MNVPLFMQKALSGTNKEFRPLEASECSVGEQTDDRIFAGREIQTKLFGLISYEYVLIFVGGVNFTSTVLHAYYTRYGTYEPHILVVVKVIWFVLALIGVLRKVSVCMAACMVCNLINGVIYCITVFAAHNFREFELFFFHIEDTLRMVYSMRN